MVLRPSHPSHLGIAFPRTHGVERRNALQRKVKYLDTLAEALRFAIEIRNGDGATQRIPPDGFVELARPEDDPSRYDWSV